MAHAQNETTVKEPALERQGRRLGRSAGWFVLLAVVLGVPGILLVIFGGTTLTVLGIVVLVFAAPPLVVGVGLALSSAVARWTARHKLFA